VSKIVILRDGNWVPPRLVRSGDIPVVW